MKVFIFLAALGLIGCSSVSPAGTKPKAPAGPVVMGDLSMKGGSPTIRKPLPERRDDPATKTNEANDQPLGYFGNMTLLVRDRRSGDTYPLDADVTDSGAAYHLRRLYFPKGGWVDFEPCELERDQAEKADVCPDENGSRWEIDKEAWNRDEDDSDQFADYDH